MIRFACPGCGAPYTVVDEKGGKAGKCRKCQVPFVIPLPPPPPAPPPVAPPPPPPVIAVVPPPPPPTVVQVVDAIPVNLDPPAPTGLAPPPPPAPSGVEIAPCPGCQARLTVDPGDLGTSVECPYCRTVFAAVRPGAVMPGPRVIEAEVVPPRSGWRSPDDDWGSRRSGYIEGPPPGDDRGSPKVKKVVRTVGGTRTIARIGIFSFAKMSGAISFVYSLIVALLYGAFLLFIFILGTSAGADPAGLIGFGIYAVCGVIIMPFIYGLLGFIGGAIFALIYNLLAQMVGGIEVDLE